MMNKEFVNFIKETIMLFVLYIYIYINDNIIR